MAIYLCRKCGSKCGSSLYWKNSFSEKGFAAACMQLLVWGASGSLPVTLAFHSVHSSINPCAPIFIPVDALLGWWHTQCEFVAFLMSWICCNITLNLSQCFSNGPMHTASVFHCKFADAMILSLYYPFHCPIFVQFCVATGWNCCMFYHLYDLMCVGHPHLFIQLYLHQITVNRRQAAAALLLYRRQNHHRYWVHPINQSQNFAPVRSPQGTINNINILYQRKGLKSIYKIIQLSIIFVNFINCVHKLSYFKRKQMCYHQYLHCNCSLVDVGTKA